MNSSQVLQGSVLNSSVLSFFVSIVFAMVVGGALGYIISYLVETVFGSTLSEKARNIITFGGAIIGYVIIKVLFEKWMGESP